MSDGFFSRPADPEVGPYQYDIGNVVEIVNVGNTYNAYDDFFRENEYEQYLPVFSRSTDRIISSRMVGNRGIIVGRGHNRRNQRNLYIVYLEDDLITLIGQDGIQLAENEYDMEEIGSEEFNALMEV